MGKKRRTIHLQAEAVVSSDVRAASALERLADAADRIACVYEASLEGLTQIAQMAMGKASSTILEDMIKPHLNGPRRRGG